MSPIVSCAGSLFGSAFSTRIQQRPRIVAAPAVRQKIRADRIRLRHRQRRHRQRVGSMGAAALFKWKDMYSSVADVVLQRRLQLLQIAKCLAPPRVTGSSFWFTSPR